MPETNSQNVYIEGVKPFLPVSDEMFYYKMPFSSVLSDEDARAYNDIVNKPKSYGFQGDVDNMKNGETRAPRDTMFRDFRTMKTLDPHEDKNGKLYYTYPKDSKIVARRTSRFNEDEKPSYVVIDGDIPLEDKYKYDYSLAAVNDKNVVSDKNFMDEGYIENVIFKDPLAKKNPVDRSLPKRSLSLSENERTISEGNRIPDSEVTNLFSHQYGNGAADTVRFLGRNLGYEENNLNELFERAGVEGGLSGLNMKTLNEVTLKAGKLVRDGILSTEEYKFINDANKLFYGWSGLESYGNLVPTSIIKSDIDFHKKNYRPNVLLERDVPLMDIRTGEPVRDQNGNIVYRKQTYNPILNNTSHSFAHGGSMSRKAAEATRGNARLVKKREEDDDDAYFQDTPRGGSDIDTLAVRVMRGELGTGEQLRRNLGTKYQAVQRRVKQLRASQGGMMGDDVDEFADDELSENAFANGGRLSRITRPNDKRYEIYF